MKENKKTFFNINRSNINHFSQNINIKYEHNKIMIKKHTPLNSLNKTTSNSCNLHVMPPQITDEDISALFKGVINVVKKKIELDNKAEIINMNLSIEKLLKTLKEKEAECIRLKNEIIYLKSKPNDFTIS